MPGPRLPLRRKKNKNPIKSTGNDFSRRQFTKEDLDDLNIPQLMCEKFGWEEAQPFQVSATRAQLVGKNVLVHASTGSGKTAIAAGPHAVPGTEGEVTLFVAPLLSLHTEMTKTFEEKYHLSTIAVNSLIQGGTKQIFKDIVNGKYQIVILAPEMLLHRRFVDAVMKSQRFRQRLRSVVIDEAHCISHWGDSFRKSYGALGLIRAFLPPQTSIVAMSGTLTRRVRRHVCKKLGFSLDGYLDINEGNARTNVSLISLRMQHPAGSFHDADILIPPDVQQALDIPKTFVYCDNKDTIYAMVDHLRTRLPSTINPEVIRPFTASQSAKYRSDAMAAFATGAIRILVCTEAAGMGCDIPGVKIAAQWKTPKTTTNAVQRGGRPARNPKEEGIYIQFNEPASFRIDPTAPPELKPKKPRNSGKKRGKQKENEVSPETQPATETSSTKPADFGFKSDVRAEPEMNEDSPGEGIYCFVQTKRCRRKVWDKVFENSGYTLTVPCCDLCDPTLLDRFTFTPPQKSSRAPRITKYEVSQQTAEALKEWRDTTFESDYPTANYDSDGFMDDELVESLSSVDPMISLETLTASFRRQWEHWDKYKDRIYAIVSAKNTRQNNQISNSPSESLEFSADSNLGEIQGERPAKRPRLSAPTRPSKQLAARKEKLSEHETKLDWGVQAQAPPEESRTNDTQSYSQSVFSQSCPPTPSLSRVQPSIHPASVGYSSNAQAKASHQRFTRPLSVSLDDGGYRQTNTPFVPSQSRYGTPVPRLQQSLPTQVRYHPYTLPNMPDADLYAHQSSSGQLAPVPAHVVPPPQYHAGDSQHYHAANIERYSQTAFEYPSGFDRITPPHEPLRFAYATAYSPDPPRRPQTDSQPAHSHLDYWNR